MTSCLHHMLTTTVTRYPLLRKCIGAQRNDLAQYIPSSTVSSSRVGPPSHLPGLWPASRTRYCRLTCSLVKVRLVLMTEPYCRAFKGYVNNDIHPLFRSFIDRWLFSRTKTFSTTSQDTNIHRTQETVLQDDTMSMTVLILI